MFGDGKRKEWKVITAIILFGIIITVFIHGIHVPTCGPYVEPQIWTERDTYYVGETVLANFVLKNKNPFPIRVWLKTPVHVEAYHMSYPNNISKGGFAGPKGYPDGLRIGIGQAAWSNLCQGPEAVFPGEIVFTFKVENMTARHTVTIVE